VITRTEFLALVLPPLQDGEQYCTVGIGNDTVRQRFVGSIDEISQCADGLVAGGFNVFFATAKFGNPADGRTTKNAVALKSFYVDLDCGEGKQYPDLGTALSALKSFCKVAKLPKPTVVKSGLGAHAYWALSEAIPRSEWCARAETLKELCDAHKFEIDPSVTGDAARVLRVPETLHVKDPTNPLKVEILTIGETIPVDILDEFLPKSFNFAASERPKFQMDALTLSLMGNKQSRFRTILVKSVEGKGCAQILNVFENQETIEEPLWRAGLSIAERCVDRDKAIHVISSKHPEYSAEETEKKAASTKGPYTCETFKKLNPKLCEGCPHKITSPITLGSEIAEATEEDNTVVEINEITKEERQYDIPKFPFPYLRGKTGGVYCRVIGKNAEGEEEEKVELVYPHDFYVVKRMHDPDLGDTVLLRLHLPKDGVRDFIMPLTSTVSKDKCIALLAYHGMVTLNKQQDAMMNYLKKWVEMLQMESKSEKAHRQFGWTDDESSIIIGDKEILAADIKYSPPSSATLPIVPLFNAKGSFHAWKDIINYYGTPGQEYRAFPFFLGFGTLLMRFTALDGFLLNLVGRNSGTGKTTVLQAINSIYGHPKRLLLSPKDTYNSRMQRLGVMQNLAVTIDEITNMPPDLMSQQIYDATSGRAKNRLKQHDNAERANNTNFQTGMISSSNRSVVDALTSIKTMPDGEMKRIIEIIYPDSNKEDATWSRNHFEPLLSNYGHAIEPYAQALVGQTEMVKAKLSEVRAHVDRAGEIRNSERFWSLMVSLAVTGGAIAKQLGLHDIPVKPVFQYGIGLIHKTRETAREYLFDADEFLGVFMGTHFSEILVINGNKTNKGFDPGPIREPRGALTMRYEPDTKLLFVSVNAYRAECNKKQMNFEESLAPYRKGGSLIVHSGNEIVKRKRLFAGTTANNNTQTSCLWFDTTKLGFFKEEVLLDNHPEPIISD
jgi:hypothetical protein